MDLKKIFSIENKTDYLLLASNIITIVFAFLFDWSLLTLVWGYWLQSTIIGFFHFLKLFLLSLKSKEDKYKVGGVFLALFFAIHYGMFHFVYFIFLSVFTFSNELGFTSEIDFLGIIIIGIIFFFNHGFSFLESLKKETHPPAFIEPYIRIIPMHLTIIFAGFSIANPFIGEKQALAVFLALKTITDLIAHKIIHLKIKFQK